MRLLLLAAFLVSCGSGDDDKPTPKDCEVGTSPEIDFATVKDGILAGSVDGDASWRGDGIACISDIEAVYAYQEGDEAPATCKDGTVEKSTYKTQYISGLKPDTQYSFRICVYREIDGYMSEGVTKKLKTKVDPDPMPEY